MSVSLPSWVTGLRDMHVRLTCTASRFSSLFPHFSDASATPTTSDVPPPVAPGTPDLSIVPSASSSAPLSWYPDAELERSSVLQHLLPSLYPSPAVGPPALPDSLSHQHLPSLATPPSSNLARMTSPPPPLAPLAVAPQTLLLTQRPETCIFHVPRPILTFRVFSPRAAKGRLRVLPFSSSFVLCSSVD